MTDAESTSNVLQFPRAELGERETRPEVPKSDELVRIGKTALGDFVVYYGGKPEKTTRSYFSPPEGTRFFLQLTASDDNSAPEAYVELGPATRLPRPKRKPVNPMWSDSSGHLPSDDTPKSGWLPYKGNAEEPILYFQGGDILWQLMPDGTIYEGSLSDNQSNTRLGSDDVRCVEAMIAFREAFGVADQTRDAATPVAVGQ